MGYEGVIEAPIWWREAQRLPYGTGMRDEDVAIVDRSHGPMWAGQGVL
jgi:hypothetical protein